MRIAILILFFGLLASSTYSQDSTKKEKDIVEIYVPPIKTGVSEYKLDQQNSEIRWNVNTTKGPQNGTIQLRSGRLFFKNKDLVSAIFNMDMNTVTISSLPPGIISMQAMNFLKSKDFLDIYAYNSAILEINTSKKIATNRYQVSGFLTIKGIKRPINFVVEGELKEDGFEGKALDIQVNREEFNIATTQASLSNDSKEQISSSVEPRFFISVYIKAIKK